ncbi:hypothetical protein Nmel_006667 [Mimus melanotis]
MEEDWQCDRHHEPCHWGQACGRELCLWEDVCGRELCLWKEMEVQEFYQWQEEVTFHEVSPCGTVRHHKWRQWEAGVIVQWGDGTEQELEMYHWEESVTEPYHCDEEICHKVAELEDVTYPCLCEGEELTPLEDMPCTYTCPRHICQCEKDSRDQKPSQKEESDMRNICDKPFKPDKHDGAQPCAQPCAPPCPPPCPVPCAVPCGPPCPPPCRLPCPAPCALPCGPPCVPVAPCPLSSSVCNQLAGKGGHDPPSTPPAPGCLSEVKQAVAAAEAESSLKPLVPELASGSSLNIMEGESSLRPLVPELTSGSSLNIMEGESSLRPLVPELTSGSSLGSSLTLQDLAENVSSDAVRKAVLETSGQKPKEQGDLKQSTAEKKEESSNSAPPTPRGSQAETDERSGLAELSEGETSTNEEKSQEKSQQ